MAQADYNIAASPSGLNMRTEINQIFDSILTHNSGSTAPTVTKAFMMWVDTSNATYYYLKMRNHDNTAWVTLGIYTVATKTYASYTEDTVKLTENQTISGVKTFTSSPIVPTPTENTQVANKEYVDASIALKTIATGTATFNSVTNNINLTGIGIGVEIGDVIQISGADDAKNNSEFTVEVITDNNNIIVNQAHANKGTTRNVATRVNDANVTVKLLSKWYNAPIGLGQAWVDVTASRVVGASYQNTTKRTINVSIVGDSGNYNPGSAVVRLLIDTHIICVTGAYNIPFPGFSVLAPIQSNSMYKCDFLIGSTKTWFELR